jgi:hypothetical protein
MCCFSLRTTADVFGAGVMCACYVARVLQDSQPVDKQTLEKSFSLLRKFHAVNPEERPSSPTTRCGLQIMSKRSNANKVTGRNIPV